MENNCNRFWPQVFSVRGTVIVRIWWQLLFIAAFTSVIVFLYDHYGLSDNNDVPKSLSLFNVVGLVTGMLLVFRTNTAYDRYWEGRKLWSEMVTNIRILTRTIWVFVDDNRDPKLLVGKISLLNMLVAFATSTKHYLREEYSREEEDMVEFLEHLPHLFTPSSNEPLDEQEALLMESEDVVLKHIKSKMSKEFKLRVKKETEKEPVSNPRKRKRGSQPYSQTLETDRLRLVTSNIPLEISFYISAYITSCKNQNLIDSPTCRIVDTSVANLVRCLTGFERIRRTPIPFAYAIHLKQITWMVLLALPFQWVHDLKWITVPAVVVTSFALLGILAIGREIENPFGYDYNDLNLDDFCKLIHKEVLAITSQPMQKPETWMFSDKNRPITSDQTLSAAALTKLSYEEVCMILSEGKDYIFHPSKTEYSRSNSKVLVENNISKGKENV